MLCQGQSSQTLSMDDISTHILWLCYKFQLPSEQDDKMLLYAMKSAQNLMFGYQTATERGGLHKEYKQMFQ